MKDEKNKWISLFLAKVTDEAVVRQEENQVKVYYKVGSRSLLEHSHVGLDLLYSA